MKTTCNTFTAILSTINNAGISNLETLRAIPSLYSDFWMALQEFCRYALCSKTSTKKANGELSIGNAYKISELERRACVMRDEIETDCAIKIIEKIELVLRQPLGRQKNYCYTICNNTVNDYCRKYLSNEISFVSINSTPENTNNSDGEFTYESIIPDTRYNPELICIENEAQAELNRLLAEKEKNEKESVLSEIACLSKRPAEVLVRLACYHLGMKPRNLASAIIEKGCGTVFAETIVEIAKKYNIRAEDIHTLISDQAPTDQSVKADSNNAEMVSCQISRLVYRADKHIRR